MSTQHTPGPQELSADSDKCRRWESLNNVITVTTPEAGALLVAAIALPAESAAIKSNEHAYTLARQIAREHNSHDDLLAALKESHVLLAEQHQTGHPIGLNDGRLRSAIEHSRDAIAKAELPA